MRYLTSADINTQRDKVAEQSRILFDGFYKKFNAAIDGLLIVQYAFTLPDTPASTPVERVHCLVQKWLYSSIFTFHASLALAEQGFCSQSITLNRGLMEHLVTVRYLADKPEDIDRLTMVSRKVRKPLTFRERFDYVIPGYYDPHYAFSSEFSHPGHGSHVLKIQPDGSGGYNVEMGITFNPESMSLCLNELTMLSAGFLKAYPTKFKSVMKYRDTGDLDRIRDATAGLLELLYGHIGLKGGENPWHKATRPLWDW